MHLPQREENEQNPDGRLYVCTSANQDAAGKEGVLWVEISTQEHKDAATTLAHVTSSIVTHSDRPPCCTWPKIGGGG